MTVRLWHLAHVPRLSRTPVPGIARGCALDLSPQGSRSLRRFAIGTASSVVSALAASVALSLGLAGAAQAADACRPLRTLDAGRVLELDGGQTQLAPRLEATLDSDLLLSDGAARFGLSTTKPQTVLAAPVVTRVERFDAELAGDAATLRFDPEAIGPAVATVGDRRFLLPLVKGKPINARGGELRVRPALTSGTAFTLPRGARVALAADGRVTVSKGSVVAWQLGDNPDFRVVLTDSTPLEQTVRAGVSDASVTVIKPSRLLPGSVMKLRVTAAGFKFRDQTLTFCFAAMPEGSDGLYTLTAPGRLVSESTDSALFEVNVPMAMSKALFKTAPGREAEPPGAATEWLGLRSSIRVMGMNSDQVVFDAAQPFVTSSFGIAALSGVLLIAVLLLLSMVFLHERNPFKLLRRLAQHRSQRFSLSNVQIMLWTLLVLYALSFGWIANGQLLDISSGVLVLLGISGGTSVLARGVENMAGAPAAPIVAAPKLKDLITDEHGDFDLLRFQMLGFTLFTLAYSFVSVIRSEGLPEIPDNLYLLMGISNGAYVTGKWVDQAKPGTKPGPAELNDFERTLPSADIQALQLALGVPATGAIDVATREAVRAFKLEHGIVPVDGSLNSFLQDRVLERTGP